MKINLKLKLILQFLLIGIIPMLVMAIILYNNSSSEVKYLVQQEITELSEMKSTQTKNYVENLGVSLKNFAVNDTTVQAAKSMKDAIYQYEEQLSSGPKDFSSLEKYYTESFDTKFKESNPDEASEARTVFANLSPLAKTLQVDYISKNQHPLGSKDSLAKVGNETTYDNLHAKYHEGFRGILQSLGLYDLFLIDPKTGVIFYSVFKELDFATSLKTGPFADTNFATAFNKATKLQKGQLEIEDFKRYWPSYQSPASFLSTPVYDGSELVAVAIFQMPLDKLTEQVAPYDNGKKTIESYIVGEDMLLRTDTHFGKEKFNLASTYKNPDEHKIQSEAVTAALSTNKTQGAWEKDYLGQEVFNVATPFNAAGKKWALVSSATAKEALAPVTAMKISVMTQILITIILNIIIGSWIGKSIANPIVNTSTGLAGNSKEVSTASTQLADAAAKLSDLATEQASSIEETAASVEEISAMVKNNAAQAEESSNLSTQVRTVAHNANEEMQSVITSMTEIMNSNKKIEELVDVINEIGQKTAVIDEIVFQTKLLSFNASVEAERAGEHGRGFSVVAQEVGNLAEMSGNAALEIASMVKESIRSAQVITAENRDKVVNGNNLVNSVAKTLKDIEDSALKLSEQSKQILTASKEQAEGIVQVNVAMEQLDQATQQNSSTAEETAAASQQLKDQADKLDGNVNLLNGIVSGAIRKAGVKSQKVEKVNQTSSVGEIKSTHPQRNNVIRMDNVIQEVEKLDGEQWQELRPQAEKMVANGSPMVSERTSSNDDAWDKL